MNLIILCGFLSVFVMEIAEGQDCRCNTAPFRRIYCRGATSSSSETECRRAGCCYDGRAYFSFFTTAIKCFEPTECPQYTCNVRNEEKELCGFFFYKYACERANCCYDPYSFPSCYRRKTTAFNAPRTTLLPITTTTSQLSTSWSQWSPWSTCSFSCSPGTRRKTRICLDSVTGATLSEALCNGQNFLIQDCNLSLCQVWSDWYENGNCSAPCGQTGIIRISRTCESIGSLGTEECYSGNKTCKKDICDSVWGVWKAWSPCYNRRCSAGLRYRYRPCMRNGVSSDIRLCVPNGFKVPSVRIRNAVMEMQRCEEQMCVTWTAWSSFSGCSRTCLSNNETAIRTVIRRCASAAKPSNNTRQRSEYNACSIRRIPCQLPTCTTHSPVSLPIIDSVFSTQAVSSRASQATLSQTATTETMSSTIPPSMITKLQTAIPVYQATTKVSSQAFSSSEPFTPQRFSTKTSAVDVNPETIFTQPTTTTTTTTTTTPSENLTYRPLATEQLTLLIETSTKVTKLFESTTPVSITPSNASVKISTDYNYITSQTTVYLESWGEWSSCSQSCGPGVMARTRICVNRGGLVLPGVKCNDKELAEQKDCNSNYCQLWSAWKSSDCMANCTSSATQGTGYKLRYRECSSKTLRIGILVPRECYNLTTSCSTAALCANNFTPIPTTFATKSEILATWNSWSEWSVCSELCAKGSRYRTRNCSLSSQCDGKYTETTSCNVDLCDNWSSWVESCNNKCNGGRKIRKRHCHGNKSIGSKFCHYDEMDDLCNTEACDPDMDILFLIDSSDYVDNCRKLRKQNFSVPISSEYINETTTPVYSKIKSFLSEFVEKWKSIENNRSNIAIQLFSKPCSYSSGRNLYVEKSFNDSNQDVVKTYIDQLPYKCGSFYLDLGLTCAEKSLFSANRGDRKNAANVLVALISRSPTYTRPSSFLLNTISQRIHRAGTTIITAGVTPLTKLSSARARNSYEQLLKTIACQNSVNCPTYIGSIWDSHKGSPAERIRNALSTASFV